jgi:7tm Odorant receptor
LDRLANKLKTITKLIILPVYTAASFVFILTAAELSKDIHFQALQSYELSLCVTLIIMLIIFSVTSTSLSESASKLGLAFYSTNWVEESPEFKNIVLSGIREAQQISNLKILCYNKKDVSWIGARLLMLIIKLNNFLLIHFRC